MHRRHAFSFPLVLALAPGCSAAASASDAAAEVDSGTPTPASRGERPVATKAAVEDLQSAFKSSIATAQPAVVSVYSTKTVSLRARRTPFDELFGVPGRRAPRELRQRGLGSGFIIDDDGHILTNNHVVEGANEIKVKLHDDRELDAILIGTDPPTDLALLKVDDEALQPVALGDSESLEVGDWVLAIGNPFGLPQTVSAGIVSAKGRANVGIVDYENFIQTDAAVNPGNSGGPLVNLAGEVVGINTAIASRSGGNNGIAFAIPVNMARSIVEQLLGDGKVVRGYLGVLISELSSELARSFDFEEEGILVQDVTEGGAGEKAGLADGDIIVELDGEPVDSVADFRTRVAEKKPGAAVTLEIWRDGSRMSLRAELGEAPGSGRANANRKPPKLGIALQDVTPRLQRQLGLDVASGVVIAAVESGSPADAAGLRPGDVLDKVGSKSVGSASDALELLGKADLAKGIRLRVTRNGQGRFVFVRSKK